MNKEDYKVYSDKMRKSIDAVNADFASVRAGRANASVLDRISVDYYGSPTPIQQIAAIASPDPRQLVNVVGERPNLGQQVAGAHFRRGLKGGEEPPQDGVHHHERQQQQEEVIEEGPQNMFFAFFHFHNAHLCDPPSLRIVVNPELRQNEVEAGKQCDNRQQDPGQCRRITHLIGSECLFVKHHRV